MRNFDVKAAAAAKARAAMGTLDAEMAKLRETLAACQLISKL